MSFLVYLFTFTIAASSFCMMFGLIIGPEPEISRLMKATPAFKVLILLLASLCVFFGYAVGLVLKDALSMST